MEELIAVLPRRMILPRTFIVHSEESLLVAGVAQIDVISLPMTAKPTSDKDYPKRRSCVLVSPLENRCWFIFYLKVLLYLGEFLRDFEVLKYNF